MNEKKCKILRRLARYSGYKPETVYRMHGQHTQIILGKCRRGFYQHLKRSVQLEAREVRS